VPQRAVGDLRLDRRALGVLCRDPRHRPPRRRVGRCARGEEEAAPRLHRGLRALHGASLARRPGSDRAFARVDHSVQLLLRRRRERDRRLPSGARRLRGDGPRLRLGLELRLRRRPGLARRLPLLPVARERGRRGRGAGHHADHRGAVRACRGADLRVPAGEGRAAGPAGEPVGAGARYAAPCARIPRSAPGAALPGVLPGRHPGGRRARRDLRRAGDEVHHAADDHPDPRGERHGRGGRLRLRLPAGCDRPRARDRADSRRLDRHGRDRRLFPFQRFVLDRGEPGGAVHGLVAGGRARARRLPRAAGAARRVLRPLGPLGEGGLHLRPAYLRRGDLGILRQPSPRDLRHRALFRRRARAAARHRRRPRPRGSARPGLMGAALASQGATALSCASALCFGTALVTAKIGLRSVDARTGAALSIPTATVLFLLAAPFALSLERFDPAAAALFALVGVFFPALVTVLTFRSNDRLGPSVTGSVSSTAPLFALAAAAALLGERIPGRALAATCGVVLGVALLSWRGRAAFPPSALWIPVAGACVRGAAQALAKAALALWPSPFAASLIGYAVSSGTVLALRPKA